MKLCFRVLLLVVVVSSSVSANASGFRNRQEILSAVLNSEFLADTLNELDSSFPSTTYDLHSTLVISERESVRGSEYSIHLGYSKMIHSRTNRHCELRLLAAAYNGTLMSLNVVRRPDGRIQCFEP